MANKKFGKWGNSIAVRLNADNIADVSGIPLDSELKITYRKGEIIIRKAEQEAK